MSLLSHSVLFLLGRHSSDSYMKGKPLLLNNTFPPSNNELNKTCGCNLSERQPCVCKREYNHCVTKQIPTVLGILESAIYLRDNPGLSFARFGDGEVDLMTMRSRGVKQTASEDLARALLQVMRSNLSNLMIGLPDVFGGYPQIGSGGTDLWRNCDYCKELLWNNVDMKRLYLTGWITDVNVVTDGTQCINKQMVYDAIREVWRDKDIIIMRGDNKQVYDFDVYDTARSQKILLAPRYQAWNSYEKLKKQLLDEDPNKMYILTCGPTCKVLAYDLAKVGRVALDMGHLAKDYDYYYGNRSLTDFFRD